MIQTSTFLTTICGTFFNLIHSQNRVEQALASQRDISSKVAYQGRYRKIILIVSLILAFFVILKNAWISDDGYITLRTVYNFIHGYGLTWNVDERVQTYTHPLWMFLLSGVYFCIRSVYFSDLLLSLSVSAMTITIFAFRLAKTPFIAVVGLAILAASKSFVDFSTSGLENPLTHLLIVLFALVFFQYQDHKRYLLWLSLLGSAMILNRMDTVLLFLPALLYVWYRRSGRGLKNRLQRLKIVLLAFLPFIAWELFSLFYYGFLFPNTAYAKLDTGIPASQLLQHGLGYLVSSSRFDPLLPIIIGTAFLVIFVRKDWKSIPLLLGMILYIAYTVRVGGDFMAGRFLTPPFLMAVILLARNFASSRNEVLALIFVAVVFLGLFVPNSRWYNLYSNVQLIDSRGVADEHFYYAQATGLIYFRPGIAIPDSYLAQIGLQARQSHMKVLVFNAIGYAGYEAGPQIYVLDDLALADPLLARLPISASEAGKWRIGHFQRDIPPGYEKTLETGRNMIQDPGLAEYYAKLHDVTSGPLFSGQRLLEIWNFNTGAYNALLQHYIQSISLRSPTPFSAFDMHIACIEKKDF